MEIYRGLNPNYELARVHSMFICRAHAVPTGEGIATTR